MFLDKEICVIRTVNTSRKKFPKSLVKKTKELERGHFELLYNGKVAAGVWQDKKPIYFVTSAFVTSPPVSSATMQH